MESFEDAMESIDDVLKRVLSVMEILKANEKILPMDAQIGMILVASMLTQASMLSVLGVIATDLHTLVGREKNV